jgi:hypothetical protein
MNVTQPLDAIGVFKPHAMRLFEEPKLLSDADEEIIITANFVSPGIPNNLHFFINFLNFKIYIII